MRHHLNIISFSFCLFGVASDTDDEEAAKSNQAIMACINILSRVAKYLYLHILLSATYSLNNMRQQLCSEVCCGPVLARRNLSEMHYL